MGELAARLPLNIGCPKKQKETQFFEGNSVKRRRPDAKYFQHFLSLARRAFGPPASRQIDANKACRASADWPNFFVKKG